MRPVLIGAGRGSRLEHRTEEVPKTLMHVMVRPTLDWILESLSESGFTRSDVVFVCGYKADVLRARYPEFTYVDNANWEITKFSNRSCVHVSISRADLLRHTPISSTAADR